MADRYNVLYNVLDIVSHESLDIKDVLTLAQVSKDCETIVKQQVPYHLSIFFKPIYNNIQQSQINLPAPTQLYTIMTNSIQRSNIIRGIFNCFDTIPSELLRFLSSVVDPTSEDQVIGFVTQYLLHYAKPVNKPQLVEPSILLGDIFIDFLKRCNKRRKHNPLFTEKDTFLKLAIAKFEYTMEYAKNKEQKERLKQIIEEINAFLRGRHKYRFLYIGPKSGLYYVNDKTNKKIYV